MKRYRVSYLRTEGRFKAIGARMIDAESRNDVPEIFYSELMNEFLSSPATFKIIKIKSMDEIEALRSQVKQNLMPIPLTIKALQKMMDFKMKSFKCICSKHRPFRKIKLHTAFCPDKFLFICPDCEQLFSVSEKSVSFVLERTGIDFANQFDLLIPEYSTMGKALKETC